MGYGYMLDDVDEGAIESILDENSASDLSEKAEMYLEDEDNAFIENVVNFFETKGFMSGKQKYFLAKYIVEQEEKY